MSDHLKLSDPNGDAEVDTIASALENADNSKRIEQLKKNIQDLKRLLAEREQAASQASASAAPNNKIGARKDGIFKAISTAPSFNLTPVGPSMVPLPYPTTIDLSNSTDVASSVRFNGKQVYTLGSSQANCKGDEQGSGGGVKSGTVNGEVKPSGASTTVRVEGKRVVRDGDPCTMNGGNNSGVYLTVPPTSSAAPRDALATSNPPVKLETPAEESAFKKWLDHTLDAMQQAVKSPIEGMKGAIKGTVNVLPNLAELLLKAAKEQSAAQMEEVAITHTMFGQTDAAKTMTDVAEETRKQEAALNVPKFKMSNSAQVGGEVISTVVQLFAAGAGAVKGIAKGLTTISEIDTASSANSKIAAEMASVVEEAKSASAITVPTGDGVAVKKGASSSSVNLESLRKKYAEEIDNVSTFKTLGIDRKTADSYLSTLQGQQLIKELSLADPTADISKIYARAIEQLSSGSGIPELKILYSPLVKIVPKGQFVSPYSPFFTTADDLNSALKSGNTLADYFGLPAKSEATLYDVYRISPNEPANVFVSKVAPTTELGGLVSRSGGGVQYLVPNRSSWSSPVLIGTIEN